MSGWPACGRGCWKTRPRGKKPGLAHRTDPVFALQRQALPPVRLQLAGMPAPGLQRRPTLGANRPGRVPVRRRTGQARIFQHPRPQAGQPLIQRRFNLAQRRSRTASACNRHSFIPVSTSALNARHVWSKSFRMGASGLIQCWPYLTPLTGRRLQNFNGHPWRATNERPRPETARQWQ